MNPDSLSPGARRPYHRVADYCLVAGTFILAFLYSFRRMADTDLWGHLKCGEYFWRTGSILKTYYFNCSWPDFPYLNHEWLFEAVVYKINEYAGEWGLIALQVALVVASFAMLYRIVRMYTDSVPLVAFVLSLGIIASQHRFALRPQHFSYLFFVYFLFSLHKYLRGDKKYAYLMPPVMVLWVNMHAESLWGLLIPGVFIAVEYLKTRYGRGMEKKDVRRFALVFAAVVAAAMINPFTYKTVLWPLFVMKEQFAGVEELLSPVTPRYLFFWIYFGVFVVSSAVNLRRTDPTWMSLGLVFAAVAWTANRGIPHFVFVSAPVIVANVEAFLERTRLRGKVPDVVSALARGLLFLGVAGLALTIVRSPAYLRKFDNIPYPDGAVRFVQANGIRGNVYNYHPWGGYLIWTSYPSLRPYIDGRFFHKRFYDEYNRIAAVAPDWQALLSKYDITVILLPYSGTQGSLNDRLFGSGLWRLVYWDDVALLYLKDVPANRVVMEKFGCGAVNPDRELYEYDETSPDVLRSTNRAAERNLASASASYKALIISANTFFQLGDYRTAANRYESALQNRQARNAWTFYRLASCYRRLGDLGKTLEYLKRCLALAPEFEEGRRMMRELTILQRMQ